ncbi:MAG: hypothetical protein CSA65_07135 [Proteobacteria bacterium]|nr:MAG: hypothetical protein CSA65_07135 [Pseudomonadota bacterium]
MPLQHTPLDPAHVSPAVARVIAPTTPAPAKMMAARGLVPMGPGDLLTVLYQLQLDADPQLAGAAKQSGERLPDNILGPALAGPLDPRVIDLFSSQVIAKPEVMRQVLLNPYTHDETFVTLAGQLREAELEILAQNAQRLLRTPAIIEALYFNKNARMSTVDRLLELAIRNGLVLDKIPQYKELVTAIMGATPASQASPEPVVAPEGQMDDVFASVLSEGYDEGPVGELEYEEKEETGRNEQTISKMSINAKIRLATLGNVFHRMTLIRDSNRLVAMAAIKSPGVSEQEVVKYASNRGLSEDVIRYICDRREWQKSYAVKLALANNPKTPLAHAMRLLTHLRGNDLRALTRSKNIPAQVVQAARRHMNKKSG